MTENEQQKLLEKAKDYRGTVLNVMTYIEFLINAYIGRHFCKTEEKAEEMVLTLLGDDRISLSAKVQVFYAIATKNDREWYDSYKSTRPPTSKKGKSPSLNNDLMYVIEERNVFAHRVVVLSELTPDNPLEKNTVRFAKFKNDITTLDYDEKKIADLYILMMNIGTHLTIKSILANNTLAPSA